MPRDARPARLLFPVMACLSLAGIMPVCAVGETAPAITPRFAAHPKFDRLVIGLPPDTKFTQLQTKSGLVLHLDGAGQVSGVAPHGRRLLGLTGGAGQLTLQLAPATHARAWRLDNRLVVDIVDDPPGKPGGASAPSAGSPPGSGRDAAARQIGPISQAPVAAAAAAALPPTPASPAGSAAPPAPAGAPVVTQPTSPLQAAAVTLLGADPDLGGPAILIPEAAGTAAAAFRRGGEAQIVLDAARPLDLSALKDDPDFGGVTERLLPAGMRLRMPLAPGAELRLAHRPAGWAVALVHAAAKADPIAARADKGTLSLAAASPGGVVVLDDEATGGKLLVGTQRSDGQYMPAAHRSAEYMLAPSWLGVVVEPVSDRLVLQPVRDGFVLHTADGPPLSLAWAATPGGDASNGRAMTRCFDFPNLTQAELHNRLTQAMRDAALTPRLTRFPARLRVAEAMLAEGLDVEANAVLQAATADDPAHADDADAAGMSAIAAWLIAQAGGTYLTNPGHFDPASLGTSDEAQFWQALFKAGGPDASAPAATLAATWPILSQYPAGLRHRLLFAVGDTLLRGGQDKAAAALLAASSDPSLDLIKARLLQQSGKTEEAIALLDAVSRRPDRLRRSEASREATEIRLAAHKIDAAAAAAQLGRQIYAWRGGTRDLSLRLRLADLRAQSGQWRQSLALLQETDGVFPDAHGQIHDLETRQVADLLRGETAKKLSALDLVALAEEASPLLSASDADSALAPVLVDKLLALDLPSRAEPILRRLFDHETQPVPKAELGVRLAGLLADRGDLKAALAVLDASDDSALASPLVTRRGILRARLLVAAGKAADALGVLAGVQDEAALDLQAKILEDRHDWAGAAKLLEPFLQTPAFAARAEQSQRDMILRLANDESQAGDMAALRRLRSSQGKHFAAGPGSELFAVLTQEPVQAVADLPRASQELDAVRALPASLATR